MSISKTLVELHDGIIEVESVLDEGTTVTVRLPGVVTDSNSTS
jgi:signal transduction histidine kinase